MAAPQSLFEKIWSSHVIHDYGGGYALVHIDRDIIVCAKLRHARSLSAKPYP